MIFFCGVVRWWGKDTERLIVGSVAPEVQETTEAELSV
jgi:hypothetical protein